jgi:hypothetical protein
MGDLQLFNFLKLLEIESIKNTGYLNNDFSNVDMHLNTTLSTSIKPIQNSFLTSIQYRLFENNQTKKLMLFYVIYKTYINISLL